MTRRFQPPSDFLNSAIHVREAVAHGVTPDELRSSVWGRPFHGVRTLGLDLDVLANRCLAYSRRMAADAVISHSTAALLWGMPLPRLAEDAVHVTVPSPRRAPEGRGVRGHVTSTPLDATTRFGFPVVSAELAWAQLGETLPLEDLVACGDFAITGSPFENVPPPSSVEDLTSVVDLVVSVRGARRRSDALELLRFGALSRPESILRVLVVRAGIPEPQINVYATDTRGSSTSLIDLAWPDVKVGVEYQGDLHRSPAKFRADIHRAERLADRGWSLIHVSADDLFDRTAETIERIATRLRSRGLVIPRIQSRRIGRPRR